MPTYRLDDLGWYQFERLIQSLLKTRFSAAIESWGGHHTDRGRDAYYKHSIAFPDPDSPAAAPLVFQVKFVAEANAAGANSRQALVAAVKAECRAIRTRRAATESIGTYVLITNAPLSPRTRDELSAILQESLPSTQVHLFGGQDVESWLDNEPRLRQAFPQLLGLRDLYALIQSTVAKPILERSTLALNQAGEVAQVFVPTQAYSHALRVLYQHHFVVLEGPPEVGKTAIGRIIALTHHSLGWGAYECLRPDDFFQLYDSEISQVFLADDAFGSTEYDPSSTARWARDLDRILRRVDAKHLLIWTARKHILQIALQDAHLQGKAETFPAPGAIVVDVSDMTIVEKALILYRHAKAARLTPVSKHALREFAKIIVSNDHFTPERIRRLVANQPPSLFGSLQDRIARAGSLTPIQIVSLELAHPTDAMMKSFRKLPSEHRSLLISMLDVDVHKHPSSRLMRVFEEAYERHRPDDSDRSFAEIQFDLLGSFVREKRAFGIGAGKALEWVHPSLRDVLIDTLASSAPVRQRFLRRCTTAGIKLALSEAGGPAGQRAHPFLKESSDWELFEHRILQLAEGGDVRIHREYFQLFLGALSSAAWTAEEQVRLQRVTQRLLEVCQLAWDNADPDLPVDTIQSFFELAERIPTWVRSPRIDRVWGRLVEELLNSLEDASSFDESYEWLAPALQEIGRFIAICSHYDPRVLRFIKWPTCVRSELNRALERCQQFCDTVCDCDESEDPKYLSEYRETAENLIQAVEFLAEDFSSLELEHDEVLTLLKVQHSRLEEVEARANGYAEDAQQEMYDDYGWSRQHETVWEIFSDL